MKMTDDARPGAARDGKATGISQTPLSDADRQRIAAHVADLAPGMADLARRIWARPELAFEEFATADAMCAVLAEAGFAVTRPVAGLPTAFVATRGQGPAVGLLAEMDALPGFSQDASPYPNPIPGQDVGHASQSDSFPGGLGGRHRTSLCRR